MHAYLCARFIVNFPLPAQYVYLLANTRDCGLARAAHWQAIELLRARYYIHQDKIGTRLAKYPRTTGLSTLRAASDPLAVAVIEGMRYGSRACMLRPVGRTPAPDVTGDDQ